MRQPHRTRLGVYSRRMTAAETFAGLDASEWTAVGTMILAVLTVVIAGVALTQYWANKRQAVQRRRADALERAAYLHIKRFGRGEERLALRSIGDHSYLRVHVQWFHPSGESETLGPDAFTISPGLAQESIETVRLPANFSWPPTFLVTFSDVIGYRFALDYEGNLRIVEEPHDISVPG
jgi:hypothetical protein